MRLGEKLQHLRAVEGQLRGLGRPLSLTDVVRDMRGQLGESLSLPYLSQIESGARPHLTAHTRDLLARFFNVHPGYLVDDPEGYQEALRTLAERPTANLAEWLALRAEELRDDAVVEVATRRLYLLHDVKGLSLDPRARGFAAVLSGHSHRPRIEERDGVVFLNPGSAGPRRFKLPVSLALLRVGARRCEAKLVELAA